MIRVKYIPSIFDDKGRVERYYPFDRTTRLKDYLRWFGNDVDKSFKNMKVIVRGKRVRIDDDVELHNHDEIIITADIKAPVVAAFVAVATLSATFTQVLIVASAVLTAYSVYQAVSAGRMKAPSFGTVGIEGSLDQSSPTYGWDGVQSTQDVGIPIRILYGQHRVGGNIINQYVRTDGENQYLNILYGICEGEVESITELELNQNPAENFDGITETYRLGTASPTVIAGFEDQHAVYPLNARLTYGNPYVYTTIAADIEAFEVSLSFAQGLYQVDSSGGVGVWEVEYKVEYRVSGGGAYTDAGNTIVSDKSRSAVKSVFRVDGLAAARYDIRVSRITADPTLSPQQVGDIYLSAVDEITTEDLAYPHLAIAAVGALATDQLSGSTPNATFLVKGLKISVPDVRDGSNLYVAWDDYYWNPTQNEFRKLSGDASLTWDGVTYVTKYCANPVWCIRDLLTNTRYGLGEYIDSTVLDAAELVEMAKYCDEKVSDGAGGFEKRFRMDVSIDSLSSAIDVLTQLTATFRAFAFYSGGAIRIKIDRADTPVQLFGMGNIVKSSFVQSWKSKKEIPNVVEVLFSDETKNYEQEIAAVIDEEALAAGEQIRKKQIRIYCTRISQALREGRFAINVAKNINRIISLRAGIDAVTCRAGDLISVSHDIPQIGFSGRVQVGSTTTVVKLDRSVTLAPSTSYVLRVRFADDTIEERTIVTGDGTYTQVTVGTAFSQTPAEYDVYSFGEVEVAVKDFRVVSIKREGDNEAEITAFEYIEDIYDTDAIVLPTNNFSRLSVATPYVTNLVVAERDTRLSDGQIEIAIDVAFARPDLSSYSTKAYRRARIYISEDNGSSWAFAGDTSGGTFSIRNGLIKDTTYKIAVTSVSVDNLETAIATSPQATVTVYGKQLLPSDVESFLVNQARDQMVFGWSEVNDADLYGYEIRKGTTWASGVVVATGIRHTNSFTIDSIEGADQSYWIKAIDTSGNYSADATEAVVTIETIPFKNIVQSYEEAPDWTGTHDHTGIEESGGILIIDPDPAASFDTIGGSFGDDTTRRWAGVAGLTGTYTTPVRDIGYRAPFKISIDTIAIAVDSTAAFDSDPAAAFDSDPLRRFSGYEVAGALSFEIRTSDDNITWTAWAAWQTGDYNCRYFQIRMTVTNSDVAINLVVPYFNYTADLPDVDEYRTTGDITVAGDGEVVVFEKTFHQTPHIAISILSGSGIYFGLSGVDTTGFTVKLYNAAGAAQTGTYSFHAHGI